MCSKLSIQKTKIKAFGPITSWQIDRERMETVTDIIFSGYRIAADGDCNHEIKRHFLLRRKAMTTLVSILKSRDITLPTKVRLVKDMVFPVVMYGCESWTIKKAEHWRTDAFELWCWKRLLRVPWTARRSNKLILKEINPEYSLEGLILKLKLQYFGHMMQRTDIGKDPGTGKDWRQEEKGMTEDDMVGWHHRLNGPEFAQAPGVDSVAWCATVHGVSKSQTWLRDWTELTDNVFSGHKWTKLKINGRSIIGKYPITEKLTNTLHQKGNKIFKNTLNLMKIQYANICLAQLKQYWEWHLYH